MEKITNYDYLYQFIHSLTHASSIFDPGDTKFANRSNLWLKG